MTLDKPQVGREHTIVDTTVVTESLPAKSSVIADASSPDWANAPLNSVRDVTLSDGTTIRFTKHQTGWNGRELTAKEQKQLFKPNKPSSQLGKPYTGYTYCASCKSSHATGQHTMPNNTTKTTTTTSTTYVSHDHDGLTCIYECKNGARLYGANKFGLKYSKPEVVLDMAGNIKCNFIKSAPRKYNVLKKFVTNPEPEVIDLDWDDYGTPPVTFEFWTTLLELLAGKNVTMTCWGGHGRTGTAMAALMIADGVEPEAAMRHIWNRYCDRAIETAGQENYLLALVGKEPVVMTNVTTTDKVYSNWEQDPKDGGSTHHKDCRCTSCEYDRVLRIEQIANQAAIEKAEEDEADAAQGQYYMFNAKSQEEEFERYQEWARSCL